jgi:hypothetical protein
MPWQPHHEDIGSILKRYETDNDAGQAFSYIGDELGNRGCWDKPVKKFSPEVRIFILIWIADGEIKNGGMAQFFYNGHGEYAKETVEAFKKVGAPLKADAIKAAMDAFPNGKYPKSAEKYSDLLEKHEDELAFLDENDLDDRYYDSPENLEKLVVDFVKDNYTPFAP